ncbi:hypothetical protein NIES2109_25910 [Nostoc sp. HK-01]|nr:hypothetical protein NIES2109_25910 [Nostoc sp. HK-01]
MNHIEDLCHLTAGLDWITIKSSNVNAVVNALELENIHQGRVGKFKDKVIRQRGVGHFEDKTNTFVFSAQHDWIIIIHDWRPGRVSKKYLNVMEQIVTELSQKFGEAQSFGVCEYFDYWIHHEDIVDYAHWILARNGVLIRSFTKASETMNDFHTSQFRNFGEVTEAESFINWTDAELFPRMPEIIQLSQKWSTEPIFSNHPGDVVGVLGYKHLQL